ncbi:MAG: hypothetical protein H0X65_06530 [Gemmatimonadetes bacterium]|nr:hypothetical protein [Gemmatimonadota bacterium]
MKHLPDRTFHPLRRWQTLRQLRRTPLPASVLFICHGNICRSPYAAFKFSAMLPAVLRERIMVSSAGFVGSNRPSPDEARTAAAARGIVLEGHRSQLITLDGVYDMQLIVVMDRAQELRIRHGFPRSRNMIIVLGDLDPQRIDTRTVRDPVMQSIDVFEGSYTRIDRCLIQLVDALSYGAVLENNPA